MESSIRIQKYQYGLFRQISEISANEIGNQTITGKVDIEGTTGATGTTIDNIL